jgi:ComF family protein
MRKIISITQNIRFPAICGLCDQYHREPHGICVECQKLFTRLGPACRYCALPLTSSEFNICGHCCKRKNPIDRVITACRFEEPLRTLIHEFKYRQGLHLLSFLTHLMLQALPDESWQTECLIPVPMHSKRLRQRGFNQAVELTKQLSRKTGIPYHPRHCEKIRNTPPQAGLKAEERRRNLRQAFKIKPSTFQHITLVDDLLTTGSTANELASMYKSQGVSSVELWCCARVTRD